MRDHNFTGAEWLVEQRKLLDLSSKDNLFVFLDLDGVANSSRSVMARTGPILTESQAHDHRQLLSYYRDPDTEDKLGYLEQYTLDTIDPVATALITRLMKKGPCRMVLNSSHRYKFRDKCEYNSHEHRTALAWYLRSMGIDWYGRLEITPNLHCERGHEVDMYIEEVLREGDKYVILDDSADYFAHHNHVKCDAKVGFSHDDYLAACNHLGITESPLLY